MYDVSGKAITVSQISNAIETLQLDTHARSPDGNDTLLSQFKHCSTVNEEKLRQAKNIKDLVRINVTTVDKALFTQTRGRTAAGQPIEETNYNMQFDPINFMQKVPCMGDRDFLINQSILHNSTCNNRITEAVNRQKFIRQTRGSMPSNARTQQNYWTQDQQAFNVSVAASKPKGNSGLKYLLPELPLNGMTVQKPRQSLHTNQTMRANKRKGCDSIGNSMNETQDRTVASARGTTIGEDQEGLANIDNRGSQIDPVRCLQKIFRKHDKQVRRPGVNMIAEKYKHEAQSAQSDRRSRMIGTANTFMTSGAFNLNSDGFGRTVRQFGLNIPGTPAGTYADTPNFFAKMDTRGSCDPTPRPSNILLKREDSRAIPPATAPLGVSRPEVVVRLNMDLNEAETSSSALIPQTNQQRHSDSKREAVTANAGGRIAASLSNTTPNDSRLDSAPSQYLRLTQGKRSTMPIMVEQETQLDKPSHIASSTLEMASENIYLNARSQPMNSSLHGSTTHRASNIMTKQTIQQQQLRQIALTSRTPPDVSPFVSEELTGAQQAIRDRLEKMKRLFQEEEDNDRQDVIQRTAVRGGQPRPQSSDWDLHRHKLEYEETMAKRKHHIEQADKKRDSSGLKGETPLGFSDGNETDKNKKGKLNIQQDMDEDELREFLMHRIAELKRVEDNKLEDLNDVKFKYRASTISNVLPSGNAYEAVRLEANYKNRFRSKGEKLHQRMLNSQQRQQRFIESAQRKSHHQDLIQARKEIVSNSKGSQINSGKNTMNSPSRSGNRIERANSSDSDTKDSMDLQRPSRQPRTGRRQINTDLSNGMNRQAADASISTQKASFNASKLVRTPKTPQGLSYSKTNDADHPSVAINDCMSENAGTKLSSKDLIQQEGIVVIHQELDDDTPDQSHTKKRQSHSELLRKTVLPQPPRTSFENDLMASDGEDCEPPNTAIVFEVDDQQLTGAKKINYFTQILRQIEKIDRNWAKEQKRRKQGLKQEALQLVRNALKVKEADESFVAIQGQMDIEDDHDYSSGNEEQVVDLDMGIADILRIAQLKRLGITQSGLKGVTIQEEPAEEINRQPSPNERMSSIQQAHKSGRTSDLIILKVAGEPCEIIDPPKRFTQRLSNERSVTNEHNTPSRTYGAGCKRHSSTLSDVSRIHTAENVLSADDQAYLQQQRSSAGTASLGPTLSSNKYAFVVMQSAAKYSQGKLPTEMGVMGEPSSMPKTVSRQSAEHSSQQSLRHNAVEASGQKRMDLESNARDSASGTKLEGDSICKIYDPKHTYSIKLSARGSINHRASTDRQGQAYDGGAQSDTLGRGSRTLTARMSQQQGVDEITTSRTLNQAHSLVTGSQLAYFCPKRFNRFPRFTIFFKKGQQNEEGSFVSENTVSLNADFLKFLSDKRNSQPTSTKVVCSADGKRLHSQKIDEERKSLLNVSMSAMKNADSSARATPSSQIIGGAQEIERYTELDRAEMAASGYLTKVPLEVQQWNEYLKQRNFDPFDRVVLVKGIDNSILTSFRTLKGENNTVSDTFKIVHRKFQPLSTGNSFFKNIQSKHADKMLYQTYSRFNDDDIIAEENIEYSRILDESTHEIPEKVHQHTDSIPKHLVVNPAQEANSRSNEMSDAQLEHAMTSALIDIENQASSSRDERMTSGKVNDKKSPFRVIQTLDKLNLPSDSNFIRDATNCNVAQGKRMPKPKPLNMATSKRKQSHVVGNERLNQQKFGIMGVSPTNVGQWSNEYSPGQPDRQADWASKKFETPKVNGYVGLCVKTASMNSANPFKQNLYTQQTNANSELNTQHQSARNTMIQSGIPAESFNRLIQQDTEKRDITLIMQPNTKFNSMAAVEISRRGGGEALSKHLSSTNQNQSTDNAFGLPSPNNARAKSRNTDICTEANHPHLTSMSQDKSNNNVSRSIPQGGDLSAEKEIVVPKSTMNVDKNHNNTSPTFLNRNQLLFDQPSAQKCMPPTIQGSQDEIVSSAGTNNNGINPRASGVEPFEFTAKDVDQESINEFIVGQNDMLQGQFRPIHAKAGILSPPLVSVVRSNTQIAGNVNSSPSMNKKRQSTDHQSPVNPQQSLIEDEQAVIQLQDVDCIQGSPIIHNALTLRVRMTKFKEKKQQEDTQQSLQGNSTAASPRAPASHQQQNLATESSVEQSGMTSWRKPAGHVGVLTVPDSIKAIHSLNSYFTVEQMAKKPNNHQKGAVSSMIDRIYDRDRKMVNNLYKGNMLNTAVLTDMSRFHKLKSQTGVESHTYDDDWLQERILEEQYDTALNLDFAPDLKSSQVLLLPQNAQNQKRIPIEVPSDEEGPSKPETSDVDSPKLSAAGRKKKIPVPMSATQKLAKKSLEGNLAVGVLKSDGQDPTHTANRESAGEVANYSEIINRSDHGTGLEKSNYN